MEKKEVGLLAIHIDEVIDYLEAHPIGCYSGGIKSLMEMIFEVYREYNVLDSDEIRGSMCKYYDLVESLTAENEEQLFLLINQLCVEREVLAFSQGIAVGMKLMTELYALS